MENKNGRQKRKLAYRSRHRLLSIDRDSRRLKERALSALGDGRVDGSDDWPWLPNKQCGSWYLPPPSPDDDDGPANPPSPSRTEVYFKSTDGHVGTYALSLKRLNLPLLQVLRKHEGCFLVDSSVRKVLPDSFSRTIPIWCAAINRLVARYRSELRIKNNGDADDNDGDRENGWDVALHAPASVVSPEEHAKMSDLIDSRAELMHRSGAIVDPRRLVKIVARPVRAIWVANGSMQRDAVPPSSAEAAGRGDVKFSTIVCFNPSRYFEGSGAKNHVRWVNVGDDNDESNDSSSGGYYYTPGAADDDAAWGRRLTPAMWRANRETLLESCRSGTDDETDAAIDSIVNDWKARLNGRGGGGDDDDDSEWTTHADRIGNTNVWIGSRWAGRPPNCWEGFDAVLNVTEDEYSNMGQSIRERRESSGAACRYLQLPVAEGKRDKTELERWMSVGLVFLIKHAQHGGRVLVHCAQGRDRSVAVAMAFVALVCPPSFPLAPRPEFYGLPDGFADLEGNDNTLYRQSGLSTSLVDALLREDGKDLFLERMHQQLNKPTNEPFADKDSLRIVLHLVRQDRENADPTRSTMQKLNRFFMSSQLYRSLK